MFCEISPIFFDEVGSSFPNHVSCSHWVGTDIVRHYRWIHDPETSHSTHTVGDDEKDFWISRTLESFTFGILTLNSFFVNSVAKKITRIHFELGQHFASVNLFGDDEHTLFWDLVIVDYGQRAELLRRRNEIPSVKWWVSPSTLWSLPNLDRVLQIKWLLCEFNVKRGIRASCCEQSHKGNTILSRKVTHIRIVVEQS